MKRNIKIVRVVLGWCIGAPMVLGACGAESGSQGATEPPISFEQFRQKAYRERETGIYIVDGDMTAPDEKRLWQLYKAYIDDGAFARTAGANSDIGTTQERLIVNRLASADDRWAFVRQLNLAYCVSTAFGTNHARVVQAMNEATAAWHTISDVAYQYRSDQDAACNASNSNVTFDVNPTSGQTYFARAFFPSAERATRNILIDAQSFGVITPFTLAGVLRHELGHTLGYRHEHTRPEARACFEDNSWRTLTAYDPSSVMFNPACGGTNKGDLVLTGLDAAGAATLYGPIPDAGLDVVFYENSYPDLQAAFGGNYATIRSHFLNDGLREGRRGSAHFDAIHYLASYPDLVAAFGATNYRAAYDHWLGAGLAEGRRASKEFDVRYYLDNNPDLRGAFGTNYAAALNHWLVAGLFEGRRASSDFDVMYYLAENADLRAALGATNYPAALAHWIQSGMREGRRGAP